MTKLSPHPFASLLSLIRCARQASSQARACDTHLQMDLKSKVVCSVLSGICVLWVCLAMVLAGASALHGKNTGGIGTLTAVTIESFHVCNGDVSFVTGKDEQVTASVAIPCESLVNTTGLNLAIDIRYNWRNPSSVAYKNVLDECSGCSSIGHSAAKNLIIASIALAVIYIVGIVAVVGSTYNWCKRLRTVRAAVSPETGPIPV